MWLKQFQVFEYGFDFETELEPQLSEQALTPCPAHARMSFGWKILENHEFSLNIHGYSLIVFGKEERILPPAVIQHLLHQKMSEMNQQRGYPVKRHEKQQLKQDIEFNLLPKAFCVQKKQAVLFDKKNRRLFIESTSPQQIDLIISLIHKTIGQNIEIKPTALPEDLTELWLKWLSEPSSLPHFLSFSDRMQWVDSDNQRKQVKLQGYDWQEDSTIEWLEKGLIPQEISFIWRDLLQFTLSPNFIFKRVQALPGLQEELEADSLETHQELSQLLIVGHTLQQLIDDFKTVQIKTVMNLETVMI
jgi:recombination associated protein RdgC